jgi:ABC-type oligopeptide transport system substrate-binding subunit
VIHLGVSPADVLSGFQSGNFSVVGDLFPSDVEILRHSKIPFQYHEAPQLCTYYAFFNMHKAPLSDEKLRHQLIQAIDVEALVRRNVGRLAMPAHSLIPPGLLGYEPKHSKTRRSSSEPISTGSTNLQAMTGSVYDGPYSSLAEEFFQSTRQLGFRITKVPQKADFADTTVLSQSKYEVDLVLTRWFGDYPDPDTFFGGLLHSKEGVYGGFSGTPELDRLIERGRTETRPQVRHQIYQEAERLMAQRAIILPLFHEKTYRFASPDTQDFELNLAIQVVPYENLWLRK